MPTPFFDSTYLAFYAPWSLPWHFIGLETVVIIGGVLAFLHAWRAAKRGDGASLFAWTTIFVYGLLMEIISYNTVDNFIHGNFTTMLYHGRLPLYISTLYPVFIYSSLKTIQRFGLSARVEPFAVGFTIVMLDMPFDILGPGAGWWTWSNSDPNLAYRWLGVPVTSYLWHCLFGGILVALLHRMESKTAHIGPGNLTKLWLSLPVAFGTIVVGVVAFIPFHLFKAVGAGDGEMTGALLAFSAAVFVTAKKSKPTGSDNLVPWMAGLFYAFHAVAALVFAAQGAPSDMMVKLIPIVMATAIGATINWKAWGRK